MTLAEFQSSLSKSDPPKNLDPLLTALWYDANGNWENAHEIAQDLHSKTGAWVHAYLHRKEGDESNASYWYRQASRKFPNTSPEDEWAVIIEAILSENK